MLKLARAEGSLEGHALESFAEALRERAGLILEERVRRQDERVQALEDENAWRRDALETVEGSLRSLEKELAWRKEAMAGLEKEAASTRDALQKENEWRRETMARLEESVSALQSEAERLRGQHREATVAHDALLGHHRDVTTKIAAELASLTALPLLRISEVRRRLVALADLLRSEIR